MRQHTFSSLCLGIVLTLLYVGRTSCRPPSDDWTLALLRGAWQYHTYDDKEKLVFVSDEILVYDGDEMKYECVPGALVVQSADSAHDWKYFLVEDRLTITFPSGQQTTFNREENGELEEQLSGKFYAMNDSPTASGSDWSDEWISFDGKRHFNSMAIVQNDSTKWLEQQRGLYRINDDRIILAYDDGTTEEALIRYYNLNDDPDGIIFHDKTYWKEYPPGDGPIVMTYKDPGGFVPPLDPIPPPLPPPIIDPIPGSTPSPAEVPKDAPKQHRDFGSTRGSKEQPGSAKSRGGNY